MNNFLDSQKPEVYTIDMPKKNRRIENPKKIWRPNPQDVRLLAELNTKLGIGESDVLRIAIRKLADSEGIPRQD